MVMIDKDSVMALFKRKDKRPMHFSAIAMELGVGKSEAKHLKRLMRLMVNEGAIVKNRKGFYGPAEDMSLISGYFEAHKEGYGFVIQETPGARDLFIPARSALGAMDNDRVLARVENASRRAGAIVRIIERAHERIIGRVSITREACFVRPKNKSIQFDIYIAPADRSGARPGQMAVVEMIDYPEKNNIATGRIIKIIESPDEPAAEAEAVIEEFNLPKRFPAEVKAEAESLRPEVGFGRGRIDLRGLNTVTIDGERARDFDDAVSIRLDKSGYTLWVHIADVGYYVDWDSAIDTEARKRGTSVYFPDRVIHMLPRELSEGLCSLKPHEQRPAFTVEMYFSRAGGRLGAKFYKSVIESNERMTYTSVRKILIDQDADERNKYEGLLADFELMGELAGLMRKIRLGRGSLDFDLPEPEILLDVQGRPEAIVAAERNFAHMMIEEFMIAANESVAERMQALGAPSLYRIHEDPDPEKVEEIMRMARPYCREFIASDDPRALYKILESVRATPIEEAASYGVLRAMKQARYSAVNAGHYGLASECYTHFTSPIRRYPDLVVHRLLNETLQGMKTADRGNGGRMGMLSDIAFSSSRRERDADSAERSVVDAMRVWFMKDKVGDEFSGRVVGVTSYGLRVRLDDFFVDGFLHVSMLTDDFYVYDERMMTLRGRNKGRRFALGDRVNVRVDRVDTEEREIAFGI